jgi:hypothetical protein
MAKMKIQFTVRSLLSACTLLVVALIVIITDSFIPANCRGLNFQTCEVTFTDNTAGATQGGHYPTVDIVGNY